MDEGRKVSRFHRALWGALGPHWLLPNWKAVVTWSTYYSGKHLFLCCDDLHISEVVWFAADPQFRLSCPTVSHDPHLPPFSRTLGCPCSFWTTCSCWYWPKRKNMDSSAFQINLRLETNTWGFWDVASCPRNGWFIPSILALLGDVAISLFKQRLEYVPILILLTISQCFTWSLFFIFVLKTWI